MARKTFCDVDKAHAGKDYELAAYKVTTVNTVTQSTLQVDLCRDHFAAWLKPFLTGAARSDYTYTFERNAD